MYSPFDVKYILRHLDRGSWVLDLGCGRTGSFPADSRFRAVRVDRKRHAPQTEDPYVIADAASLPFRDGSFGAVVANHSLEHFEQLEPSLHEIRRTLAPRGALFVSVPDATTLTDRLYRWLAQGGGHVNAFTSAKAVGRQVETGTGLQWVATRPLFSSFSFLNRHNRVTRAPRKLLLLGGGHESVLRWGSYWFRVIDRLFKTRLSRYGWAFYFGQLREDIPTQAWSNVCVRCGSAHPSQWLRDHGVFARRLLAFHCYRCPGCGAVNLMTDDTHFHSTSGISRNSPPGSAIE